MENLSAWVSLESLLNILLKNVVEKAIFTHSNITILVLQVSQYYDPHSRRQGAKGLIILDTPTQPLRRCSEKEPLENI